MFETIYTEELTVPERFELDTIARIPTILKFLRLEKQEIEKILTEMPINPGNSDEFMLNNAIIQSRKNCIKDLIEFLEDLRKQERVQQQTSIEE